MKSVVLCFAAALMASASDACSHVKTCPCGLSDKNYTFCIDGSTLEENFCERRLKCETCQEGVSHCITCPSDRSGRLCTTALERKLIRKKRRNDSSRSTICGVNEWEERPFVTNVANGKRAKASEWPWMVAISVRMRNNYTSMICGGALLDKRTVLSAAHCFNDRTLEYVLHFGKLHRRNVPEIGLEVRRGVKIISHPEFNATSYANDIALIKLKSKLLYTKKIVPICLPTPETTAANLVPGNKGIVTGYGITEAHLLADDLMMARLPVQSDRKCVKSYRRRSIALEMEPGMFCAGYRQGVTSACRGDSGSPFVFYNSTSRRYTLEGCVSFNARGQCALPEKYTVFTKISYYLPWIEKNRRRRT